MIKEAMAIADSKVPDVQLYPDAKRVLSKLRTTSKEVALVTTSHHAVIDPLLIKHDLVNIFSLAICGDDVTHIKPDPEPILQAIKQLGAEPSQTVLVGDSESDIVAAERAGIDSVLVYPHSHDRFHSLKHLQSLNPTHVVHDLPSLMALLQ